MPHRRRRAAILVALLAVLSASGLPGLGASRPAVTARSGMVVSSDPIASQVGVEVLQRGGTAVDAAVAVSFALAVVLPSAGNLGGGGFLLHRDGQTGAATLIDFRETAPARATRDMFLGADGEPVRDRSRDGYLAVAVPGTVAGLEAAHQRYGLLPWRRLVGPAIGLARRGVPVSRTLARDLEREAARLARFPASAAIFLPNGKPLGEGDQLRQPDLARTLGQIARHGAAAFYGGPIADAIDADMRAHGGIVTKADLAAYRPRVRRPITGTYGEYEILVAPPPSSGGIVLLEILNILEPYDLAGTGTLSSKTIHLMTEAERRAYADRAALLGDPDFFPVPVDALISKQYALRRGADIVPGRATPSSAVGPGNPLADRPTRAALSAESPDTTHFAVVDRWRNIVAFTTTLNDRFGCKAVVGGTGIVLNDEMDDFSTKPGAPNLYNLVGGEANAIAPGKRPLSSMCPTIVLKDARPYLVLGTPGGATIITSVAQVFLNLVEHGMALQEAVDAPRVHHQWLPDRIDVEERALPEDVRSALEAMGHKVAVREPIGDFQAIRIDAARGLLEGASDPRGSGEPRGY